MTSDEIRAPLSRRHVLSLAMGMGVFSLPVVSASTGVAAQAMPARLFEWTGTALGAPARILIAHPDRVAARSAIHRAVMELERLENEFSLYRDGSAISRLNRDGVLVAPSMDMRFLLSLSKNIGGLSNGAFDVTVQPLWALLAEHLSSSPQDGHGPSLQTLQHHKALINFRRIDISADRVRLGDGMAVTLNGIAQGYVTDRVAALLKTSGLVNALVELGETYGAGQHSRSRQWQVDVLGSAPGQPIALGGCGLAVSATRGTVFTQHVNLSHLLNPITGQPTSNHRTVYVTHASTTIADALSTALCIIPTEQAPRLVKRFPGARAFEITPQGVHTPLI